MIEYFPPIHETNRGSSCKNCCRWRPYSNRCNHHRSRNTNIDLDINSITFSVEVISLTTTKEKLSFSAPSFPGWGQFTRWMPSPLLESCTFSVEVGTANVPWIAAATATKTTDLRENILERYDRGLVMKMKERRWWYCVSGYLLVFGALSTKMAQLLYVRYGVWSFQQLSTETVIKWFLAYEEIRSSQQEGY